MAARVVTVAFEGVEARRAGAPVRRCAVAARSRSIVHRSVLDATTARKPLHVADTSTLAVVPSMRSAL
jgi:hypothetical protein